MEKTAKLLSRLLCGAISLTAAVIGCFYTILPSEVSVEAGVPYSGGFYGAEIKQDKHGAGFYLGAIPIKSVSADHTVRPMLVPCGTPFGIKLRTQGVIAVSVNEDSPAEECGIKQGDLILSVNGMTVSSNSEVCSAIQLCPDECEIILQRGDSEKLMTVVPYEDCGIYKIGIWVRDSAAGIGTMTYYNPEDGGYGGLGHPVSDVTTGELMPLASGEITEADISGVTKGIPGEPGELCGTLRAGSAIGTIDLNTQCGIFGCVGSAPTEGEVLPMAFRQEVRTGAATLLTTVNGSTPQEYDIEIEHINICDMESSKSMVIRITDRELLDITGGIVCGMSGSPIIQDGKLVGAVTHVFLNDPQRGYAVFCETMVENEN